MDFTPIIEIIITIITIVFSSYILPYLIKKVGINKVQDAYSIIKILVEAVEQIDKHTGKDGVTKKIWVMERLKNYNIQIDENRVSELIESAVLEMNSQIKK